MTLEARGAELEPGRARGNGKTPSTGARRAELRGGVCAGGVRAAAGGLLAPPQVWGTRRKHPRGWNGGGRMERKAGEPSAL